MSSCDHFFTVTDASCKRISTLKLRSKFRKPFFKQIFHNSPSYSFRSSWKFWDTLSLPLCSSFPTLGKPCLYGPCPEHSKSIWLTCDFLLEAFWDLFPKIFLLHSHLLKSFHELHLFLVSHIQSLTNFFSIPKSMHTGVGSISPWISYVSTR